MPALLGLGTPHWDYGARGTLLGLTRGTSRAHVVRAVLEGIAHRGADLVEAAEADTGLTIPSLRVDGGMSANPTFVQALADATGRPVEVSPVVEATTLGAAFLAGPGRRRLGRPRHGVGTGGRRGSSRHRPSSIGTEWAEAVGEPRHGFQSSLPSTSRLPGDVAQRERISPVSVPLSEDDLANAQFVIGIELAARDLYQAAIDAGATGVGRSSPTSTASTRSAWPA